MTALVTCCVGDSITYGRGDAEALGWPGRLARIEADRGHDPGLYNLGIRADTGADVSVRWRAECAARLPSGVPAILLFAFGLNDTAEEVGVGVRASMAQAVASARVILTKAKAWHPTLWIGPTPIDEAKMPLTAFTGVVYDFRNERLADYNRAYAALADEIGVPYFDFFSPLLEDATWRREFAAGDGIHPTAATYGMMAQRIADWAAWRQLLD